VTARRKRVWTCADFAEHAYRETSPQACRRARRALKALDAKHNGALLIPSAGTNREFTFYPATLARLEKDLFSPIESLEFRVDDLEEGLDTVKADQRDIASQVRINSRELARRRSTA
jgi:hypothetical protein